LNHYHLSVKNDCRQSEKEMLTDTQDGFRHRGWPQLFSAKRRKFSRQAENQPYIEWLHSFNDNEGDGDEDDDEDEDGEPGEGGDGDDDDDDVDESSADRDEADEHAHSADPCNGYSAVRHFMKGTTGDEERLQFQDQVEVVAGFRQLPTFRKSEKRVALLDDRNDGGTILEKQGHCRRYQGPLTSKELCEELGIKVARPMLNPDF
jgi:hypothetical protein